MRSGWEKFKAFWTAEEVPRWFGLLLVLVYLTGLGGVAYTGINAVCREADARVEAGDYYAVSLLADRLGEIRLSVPADRVKPFLQRELIDFSVQIPTRYLRLVTENRQIVASSISTEQEGIAPDDHGEGARPGRPAAVDLDVMGQPVPDRLFRVPVNAAASATEVPGSDAPEPLFLEARMMPALGRSASLAGQVNTAIVVLVALGALFVLYHRLRGQLRSAARIVERLQTHSSSIQENLTSLRLDDEVDGVTSAWNRLVDLTQTLSNTVRQTSANDELSRALMRAGGGALAEALHAVPDGIMYVSEEVRFEYLNAAACRLLGWKPADIKAQNLAESKATGLGGRILDVLRGTLQSDGSFAATAEIVDMDAEGGGDGSAYRMWVIPLQRAQRSGECVVVIRDVSQQMRADRAREDFITQVTHELRTPLTNIRAYAETLSSGMFEDPKVITECYNVITKETRRLSRLIEDILSVSQLEVGSIELHLDQIDLKTLLTDGVRDVRNLGEEKNIDIQLLLPAKLEPIRADRDKLAVVINNLLGNAIKYTPSAGNIIVGCQYSADAVSLTFKDNGIGIAPEDHARVFEKFQRANDPAVQNEAGTGIGLYTAREIVRRHGGDIELISEKGVGSTFLVRLPHRESRAAALTSAEEV